MTPYQRGQVDLANQLFEWVCRNHEHHGISSYCPQIDSFEGRPFVDSLKLDAMLRAVITTNGGELKEYWKRDEKQI